MNISQEPIYMAFKAGLAGLIGLALAVWSCRVMREPSRLRRGTFIYRWLQNNTWRWKKAASADTAPDLTPRQIRFWASMALITGILMVLAGVAGFVEMVIRLP